MTSLCLCCCPFLLERWSSYVLVPGTATRPWACPSRCRVETGTLPCILGLLTLPNTTGISGNILSQNAAVIAMLLQLILQNAFFLLDLRWSGMDSDLPSQRVKIPESVLSLGSWNCFMSYKMPRAASSCLRPQHQALCLWHQDRMPECDSYTP